jgi:hypothetical protein
LDDAPLESDREGEKDRVKRRAVVPFLRHWPSSGRAIRLPNPCLGRKSWAGTSLS